VKTSSVEQSRESVALCLPSNAEISGCLVYVDLYEVELGYSFISLTMAVANYKAISNLAAAQ